MHTETPTLTELCETSLTLVRLTLHLRSERRRLARQLLHASPRVMYRARRSLVRLEQANVELSRTISEVVGTRRAA